MTRSATTRGVWPNAVVENFHERPSGDPDRLEIWCYTDALSYQRGDRVQLHVSTTAHEFDLSVTRDGAEAQVVLERTGLPGQDHPTPEDCSALGCGWPVAFEFALPADWRSGGYIVEVRARARDGQSVAHHHFFALCSEPDGSGARILQIAATSTWIAYNDWGGSNHYEGITGPDKDQFSPLLSIARPLSRGFVKLPLGAPRIPLRTPPPMGAAVRYPHMEWAYANGYSKKYASAGWASYDRHFFRWAEAQGYALDLATQHDLQFRPQILDGYALVVIVGHDEYWSWEMRDAIERYLDGGGRVARFAGNFFWQIRLEQEGRVQVCYKARYEADPLYASARRARTTMLWESALVDRPGALTFGLNGARGVYAGWGGCAPRGAGGFTVYRPDHWAFAGTDLYYGDILGAQSRVFGYEVDGLDYTVRDGLPYPTGADGAPEGIEILAMGLATVREEDHGNNADPMFIAENDVRMVAAMLYGEATPETVGRAARGAGMMVSFARGDGAVFNAGSCEWVAGLIERDPYIERITRNVIDRFLRARD